MSHLSHTPPDLLALGNHFHYRPTVLQLCPPTHPATQLPPLFPAWLRTPENVLLQSVFSYPISLLSSVGWNIIYARAVLFLLPTWAEGAFCVPLAPWPMTCLSLVITIILSSSSLNLHLLFLPSCYDSIAPHVNVLPPSLGDVGHCHPKPRPPDSSRVGQAAQHSKEGCRPSSSLGDLTQL